MFDWVVDIAYGITNTIAYFLGLVYNCFELVVGLKNVSYNGSDGQTLLEVVFNNSILTRAYWGMAIIGVGLCFFFTILAVIRKMFDSSDQMKTSLGEILTQCLKSILLICSMSLILNMTLYFSKQLLQAIQYAFFANTASATEDDPKLFSDEEYAAMARVLNTIGNYSVNPSFNSRYNINSCYNDIRQDLKALLNMGTFDVQYDTPDMLFNSSHYWQESLQKIVNASPNLDAEMPLDVYNETLSTAILNTMDQISKNEDFKPLSKYANQKYQGSSASDMPSMDRIILLMGTFDAARNPAYNGDNAYLTDPVRGPFYYGSEDHDVYEFDNMNRDFDMWDYGYFTAIFLSFVLLKNMLGVVLNSIARIFNMTLLYVVAPPFIALSPLDGGSKFKQWTTSFVVQCFGVFGTVVAMDLMVVFVPIIMSGSLVLFDNCFINYFAKVLIVWGAYETVQKANGLISGILAENASMSSASAGDMTQSAQKLKDQFGKAYDKVSSGVKSMFSSGDSKDKDKNMQQLVKAGGGSYDMGGKGASGGGPSKEKNGDKDTDKKDSKKDSDVKKQPGGDSDKGDDKGEGSDVKKQPGGDSDKGDDKGEGSDVQKQPGGDSDKGDDKGEGSDVQKQPGGDSDKGDDKGEGSDVQKQPGGDSDKGDDKGEGSDVQKQPGGDSDNGEDSSKGEPQGNPNPVNQGNIGNNGSDDKKNSNGSQQGTGGRKRAKSVPPGVASQRKNTSPQNNPTAQKVQGGSSDNGNKGSGQTSNTNQQGTSTRKRSNTVSQGGQSANRNSTSAGNPTGQKQPGGNSDTGNTVTEQKMPGGNSDTGNTVTAQKMPGGNSDNGNTVTEQKMPGGDSDTGNTVTEQKVPGGNSDTGNTVTAQKVPGGNSDTGNTVTAQKVPGGNSDTGNTVTEQKVPGGNSDTGNTVTEQKMPGGDSDTGNTVTEQKMPGGNSDTGNTVTEQKMPGGDSDTGNTVTEQKMPGGDSDLGTNGVNSEHVTAQKSTAPESSTTRQDTGTIGHSSTVSQEGSPIHKTSAPEDNGSAQKLASPENNTAANGSTETGKRAMTPPPAPRNPLEGGGR